MRCVVDCWDKFRKKSHDIESLGAFILCMIALQPFM